MSLSNTVPPQPPTFFSSTFGLKEPICDADGLYNGCLAPPEQARILYYMSWVGGATGLVGIYYGHYWLGLGTFIGSIFAQLYWQNPTFSCRRTVDMVWLQVLIWTHLWVAAGSPVFLLYAIIQIFGVIAYAISWYLIKQGNNSWGATFFHFLVHLAADTSLLILYTA